jgi:tetratricopeptide (TPR) repeat protein
LFDQRPLCTLGVPLINRWFESIKLLFAASAGGGLEKKLSDLETQAKQASPGTRWVLFNRAGDASLKAGDRLRALQYFGRAIDTLLEDDQPEPARAVAKKVIRLHPEAIRTLCTLTWLDLASRKVDLAIESLSEYVKVAKEGQREKMACGHVREMARLVNDEQFLQKAAAALEEMSCPADADMARGWLEAGGSPDAPEKPEDLYRLCMKAAIGSNEKMKAKGALA